MRYVVGDRLSSTYFEENKRPFHNIAIVLFGEWYQNFPRKHTRYHDGLSCIQLPFCKNISDFIMFGLKIETEMSIHAIDKRMQVENVIVPYRDRPEGSVSKLNTFLDGWSVIKTLIRLFRIYNPFAFFGIISIMLFLISLVMFVPVLITYIETGLVPRYPTLIAQRIFGQSQQYSLQALEYHSKICFTKIARTLN